MAFFFMMRQKCWDCIKYKHINHKGSISESFCFYLFVWMVMMCHAQEKTRNDKKIMTKKKKMSQKQVSKLSLRRKIEILQKTKRANKWNVFPSTYIATNSLACTSFLSTIVVECVCCYFQVVSVTKVSGSIEVVWNRLWLLPFVTLLHLFG